DLGIEPGTQDANLSNRTFIRTHLTKSKLEKIYKREQKRGINSTYNLNALKALIDIGPDGQGETEYAEYVIPSQDNQLLTDTETYSLIACYSPDPEEEIVTFHPSINQWVRKVENNSKFGFPRILFLVIDPAELSPLGDSRVRLASPNQNLMMALRQN